MNIFIDNVVAQNPGTPRHLIEGAFRQLEKLGYDPIRAFDRVNLLAADGKLGGSKPLGHSDPTADEAIVRERNRFTEREEAIMGIYAGMKAPAQGRKFTRQGAL